jgi:hypothetical protein
MTALGQECPPLRGRAGVKLMKLMYQLFFFHYMFKGSPAAN